MSYDPSNAFAQILEGKIPAHVVEETEHTLAFMDIMPQAPGHTLVIHKEQSENLFEISDQALQQLIVQVRRIARAVRKTYPDAGIRITQLNGSKAGQTVFHLHFHVIPADLGFRFKTQGLTAADPQDLADSAASIRAALE